MALRDVTNVKRERELQGDAPPSKALKRQATPTASVATEHKRALNRLYDKEAEVSDLFPDVAAIGGAELIAAIYDAYTEEICVKDLYQPDGSPAFERDVLNPRKQETHVQRLRASVATHGIVPGVRGELCCKSRRDMTKYGLLSGGSLLAAFYDEHGKDPSSPILKASAARGVMVRRLHEDTPPSVILHIVDYCNCFHFGSATSFMEVLLKIPIVEARWSGYRSKHGVSAKQVDYEKSYRHFIDHNFKVFRSFDFYKHVKPLYHKMLKYDLLDALKADLEIGCVWTDDRLKQPEGTLNSMNTVLQFVISEFGGDGWTNNEFTTFCVELLKMVVPVVGQLTLHECPLYGIRDATLLSRLLCDLTQSKVMLYPLSSKAKAKAKSKAEKASKKAAKAKRCTKKRQKAANKENTCPSASAKQGAPATSTPIAVDQDGATPTCSDTAVNFANDVINVCFRRGKAKGELRATAVNHCLQLAMTKTTTISVKGNPTVISTWSKLRPHIQTLDCPLHGSLCLADFLFDFSSVVFRHFPPALTGLTEEALAAKSCGIFKTVEALNRCVQLRAAIVLLALRELSTGHEKVIVDGFKFDVLDMLLGPEPLLLLSEIHHLAATRGQFVEFDSKQWTGVLQCATAEALESWISIVQASRCCLQEATNANADRAADECQDGANSTRKIADVMRFGFDGCDQFARNTLDVVSACASCELALFQPIVLRTCQHLYGDLANNDVWYQSDVAATTPTGLPEGWELPFWGKVAEADSGKKGLILPISLPDAFFSPLQLHSPSEYGLCSDCPCPAWMIKVSHNAKLATTILDYRFVDVDYRFVDVSGTNSSSVRTITLCMPFLKPNPDYSAEEAAAVLAKKMKNKANAASVATAGVVGDVKQVSTTSTAIIAVKLEVCEEDNEDGDDANVLPLTATHLGLLTEMPVFRLALLRLATPVEAALRQQSKAALTKSSVAPALPDQRSDADDKYRMLQFSDLAESRVLLDRNRVRVGDLCLVACSAENALSACRDTLTKAVGAHTSAKMVLDDSGVDLIGATNEAKNDKQPKKGKKDETKDKDKGSSNITIITNEKIQAAQNTVDKNTELVNVADGHAKHAFNAVQAAVVAHDAACSDVSEATAECNVLGLRVADLTKFCEANAVAVLLQPAPLTSGAADKHSKRKTSMTSAAEKDVKHFSKSEKDVKHLLL
ncbi:unnamed protein product [Polarella glacialis]|uniref:Uncharacterized protein n=1 Tax=Polarella glacialis TaxID=89957 RepID=A0A813FIQ0_POLGL|nr:unnamed protein product [Polarella glacialis]